MIPLYIYSFGVPPSFKERITCFLVFLALWPFYKFFKVDSVVAGASKIQEDAL